MSFLKNKIFKNNNVTLIISYFLVGCILLIALSRAFSYSIDLEGMEFSFLYHLQLLKKIGTVYTNPDKYPYFICFYPPFYSAFMYKCCSIFKINVFTDLHRALVFGRLLSFILLFINTFYIKKIVELLTENSVKKIQVLLLLLLLFPVHFFTFRPDSLKVTFFVLFVFQFLNFQLKTNKTKNFAYAIIFAVISIFFKHDTLIYIYAFLCLNWLFFNSSKTFFFTIILSFIIAFGFLICIKIYGTFFIKNLFFYTIQYSGNKQLNLQLIVSNIAKISPLLIISYLNFFSKNKNIKFIAVLSFVFAITSNIMLLRAGSNLNYTYECSVFLIINTIFYFSKNEKIAWKYIAIIIFLILFSGKHINVKYVEENNKKELQKGYVENIESAKKIKEIVGNDVVFFTNGKYTIFNAQLNIMYGYDLHLDRFTEVYMNIPIQSTMFKNKSVNQYDSLFLNGFIKYIIIENNSVSLKQMKKYYPEYTYSQAVNNLLVYKYESPHN